jgi:hypothetical protein
MKLPTDLFLNTSQTHCTQSNDQQGGVNEENMVLVIKRFKTALKGRKDYPNKNKSRGKCSCFKCGKSDHFITQCPDNEND